MEWRPRITLTYAQSLDGRIATVTGDSQWISGDDTIRLAHELRDAHDAILVGIGTVLADDPRLTCRLPGGHSPHRIVLDSTLRTPLDAHVVTGAREVPTTIFCGPDAPARRSEHLRQAGVEVVQEILRTGPDEGGALMSWQTVLSELRRREMASLLVEGGAGVLTSLFRNRLVDRLVLVSAPVVIGSGRAAVGDLGVEQLSEAWRGRTVNVRQAGEDIVWEVEFENGS